MTSSNKDNKISHIGQNTITNPQPKIRVYQLSLQWTVAGKNQLNLILQT